MKATVTKYASTRWLVEGEITVVGGRVVHEPYARVFRTKKEAEIDAEKLDEQNVEGLEYVAEQRAARLDEVRAYLAGRAKRAEEYGRQLQLF